MKISNKNFVLKTRKEHDEYTSLILRFLIIRPIAKILIKYTKITPNQMTLMSVIPGIIGIILLSIGDYKMTILGAIFSFAYGIMDGIDGIIARARNLKSRLGAWLDGTIGFVLVPIMILATAIGLKNYLALVIGSVAALSFPIQFTIVHYYKSEIVKDNERIEISSSGKFNCLRYIYGYALFYPLLLFGAIFNQIIYVLLFFAVIGTLVWMITIYLEYKSIRSKGE